MKIKNKIIGFIVLGGIIILGAVYFSGSGSKIIIQPSLTDAPPKNKEKGGAGFVGILGDKLPRGVHREAAKETLTSALKIISARAFDLVVLDEINVALNLKLIPKKSVLALIKKMSKDGNLILTGREAAPEIVKLAHLVTEFREEKHPFSTGIKAKKGLEY